MYKLPSSTLITGRRDTLPVHHHGKSASHLARVRKLICIMFMHPRTLFFFSFFTFTCASWCLDNITAVIFLFSKCDQTRNRSSINSGYSICPYRCSIIRYASPFFLLDLLVLASLKQLVYYDEGKIIILLSNVIFLPNFFTTASFFAPERL